MDTPPVRALGQARRRPPRVVHQTIPALGRTSFARAEGDEAVLVILAGVGKVLTDTEIYPFVGPCALVLGPIGHCTIVNQGATPMQLFLARVPVLYLRPSI